MLKTNKLTQDFLRISMTNCTSWIWVFLVFKPPPSHSTVWDKIWTIFLPHFQIIYFLMGIDLSLLLILREPKQVFIGVTSNIIKLGNIWEIQILIIPCPAFRGQETGKKEKNAIFLQHSYSALKFLLFLYTVKLIFLKI